MMSGMLRIFSKYRPFAALPTKYGGPDSAFASVEMLGGLYEQVVILNLANNPVSDQTAASADFVGGLLYPTVITGYGGGTDLTAASADFVSGFYKTIVMKSYNGGTDITSASVDMAGGSFNLVLIVYENTVQEQSSASVAFTGGSYNAV